MGDYYSLLYLNHCKVQNQLASLQGNEYSNISLDSYQHNLFSLFKAVSKDIEKETRGIKEIDFEKIDFLIQCLYFISLSVRFLEDSILNLIPYETVFCLDKALKEWVGSEKYTFVTSLNKDEYFFDEQLSIDEDKFFDLIEDKYNIAFSNRLIQISVPKHEVKDYFFNVVLYHELGHFVDLNFKISESIVYEEFPGLSSEDAEQKINHYREFFADLFAAQYIDINVSLYLEYEAPFDGDCFTHPSTEARSELVKDFLEGHDNPIISQIQNGCKSITEEELRIRYKEPNISDFFNYIPPIIESDEHLHGLFVIGWKAWRDKREQFSEKNLFKQYTYLNNLIEKSISNYMVTTEWNSIKQSLDVPQ